MLIYIGETEKEIPNYGLFKPGDEVEFNQTLFETGLFKQKEQQQTNVEAGAN